MAPERTLNVLRHIKTVEFMLREYPATPIIVARWRKRLIDLEVPPAFWNERLTSDIKDIVAGSWRGGPYSPFEQALVILGEEGKIN